jgi:dienelactone hydrolase
LFGQIPLGSVAPLDAERREEPRVAIEGHFDGLRDTLAHAHGFACALVPLDRWQRDTRRLLAERLGLDLARPRLRDVWEGPAEEREIHGTRFTMRRVLLRTEDDLWVPAFLCLPPGATGALPTVICCQGHATAGMRVSVGLIPDEQWQELVADGDRDFALQAVRMGYAALALEMRGFGELRLAVDRERDANNSCARLSLLANEAGTTLLAMRVHDIRCAVDYVHARHELDGARLALTGNSGGGTVTLYAAALEERLAAAIPSCAFCTFADSIQSVDHCACNFVPGLARDLEMQDIAGLIAPRPLLVIAGREDGIFPLHGVETAWRELAPIYEASGHAERLHLYVGEGGHRYYAAPVEGFLREALAARA